MKQNELVSVRLGIRNKISSFVNSPLLSVGEDKGEVMNKRIFEATNLKKTKK